MIKWLGYKQVRLTSIKVDAADIRKRTKAAHVADLASNIRESGEELIHAPTVRASDKSLRCGRDRYAALLVLKVKKAWVHLVECDDVGAKELELAENIYRRADNRAELLAAMVELKEQQYRAEHERAAAEGGTVSRAPQDSPKAKARKDVARAGGISPAAVKKAEQRAKDHGTGDRSTVADDDGNNSGAAVPPATEQVAPNLDLLGVDDHGTRIVCGVARPYQVAIDGAAKYLALALGALKPIENLPLGQELRAQVERVGSLVRSARPDSICPWCKGLPKATVGLCGGCKGMFFINAEVAARAPRELREGAVVAIDGKFYPYADVRDGRLPAKNGAPKNGRRISAELPDGRVVDPVIEADESELY